MIYYLIACGLLILQIIDQYLHVINHVKRLNIIFPFISIFFILFSATRDSIGLDYRAYKEMFETVKFNSGSLSKLIEINQYYQTEISYLIICLFSKKFYIVLLIYAILGVGIKCYVINKICRYKYLALFFYFTYCYIYFDMGVMRQGVAMSFMMLALVSLNEEHKFKFYVYVVLGTVFHATALLLLPFVLVKKLDIKMKYLFAVSFPCFILSILGSNMLLQLVSKLLPARLLFKFNAYSTTESVAATTTIIKGIIFFSILYYISKYVNKESVECYLKCYWYGIILMTMTSVMPTLAYRGTQFFGWEKHFFIDSVLSDVKSLKKREKVAVILMLLMFIGWSFYTMARTLPGSGTNNYQGYLPYKSILF